MAQMTTEQYAAFSQIANDNRFSVFARHIEAEHNQAIQQAIHGSNPNEETLKLLGEARALSRLTDLISKARG